MGIELNIKDKLESRLAELKSEMDGYDSFLDELEKAHVGLDLTRLREEYHTLYEQLNTSMDAFLRSGQGAKNLRDAANTLYYLRIAPTENEEKILESKQVGRIDNLQHVIAGRCAVLSRYIGDYIYDQADKHRGQP